MIAFANAKINIGLHILEKLPSGYHNIETLMVPIKWHDVLEIVKSDKFELHISGKPVDAHAKDNLITKAVRLIENEYKISPVKIYLHKILPMGAGIGGGSSDAAFTIILLNKIFELQLSDEEMMKIASRLGSDCPFFIKNKPCIASGTGVVLEEYDINFDDYKLIIINPKIHISTAEAYASVTPDNNRQSLKDLLKKPIEQWRDLIVNDFQKTLFVKYPLLKQIETELYSQGAIYASMTGSGSVMYGIFEKSAKPIFSEQYTTQEVLFRS